MQIHVPEAGQPVMRESFHFSVNKSKLNEAELRNGRYLLRSSLADEDRAVL